MKPRPLPLDSDLVPNACLKSTRSGRVPEDNQREVILKVARQIAAANDDEEQAGLFFTRVVQAFVLLDQMAPQFIEMVDEYHIGENPQATDCHLCKLRAAAEEYLAERKTNDRD
jgi:hypothetical protein